MVKKTSFGSLEVLVKHRGKTVVELATFNRSGKSHTHEDWEICHVTDGRGVIRVGEKSYNVSEGISVFIPPKTGHYMIPDPKTKEPLKIVLIYSSNRNSHYARA